jgi:hypothetical protein
MAWRFVLAIYRYVRHTLLGIGLGGGANFGGLARHRLNGIKGRSGRIFRRRHPSGDRLLLPSGGEGRPMGQIRFGFKEEVSGGTAGRLRSNLMEFHQVLPLGPSPPQPSMDAPSLPDLMSAGRTLLPSPQPIMQVHRIAHLPQVRPPIVRLSLSAAVYFKLRYAPSSNTRRRVNVQSVRGSLPLPLPLPLPPVRRFAPTPSRVVRR